MKILLIIYNPCNNNNNSKTVRSFFCGVKAEDMAMLYMESFSEVDYGFCDSFYRVTDQDVIHSITNLSFKTHNTHPVQKPKTTQRDDIMKKASKRQVVLRVFREMAWKLHTWDSKELNEWVKEQKPDIIFSLFGNNLFVHDIVTTISKRYKIPFVCYYTDDYVLNCFNKSFFGRIHWWMSKRTYRRSMRYASKCYVIGEKMRKDYSRVFGREFGMLGNCIDFAKFKDFQPRKIDTNKKIVISYVGGVHLNRWQSVCELGRIVKEINDRLQWQLEIDVYSMEIEEKVKEELANNGVFFKGSLDSQGVMRVLESSDFLLHVESFDEINRVFVRYSISTKISEYFASKRYILAYGPSDVASIELLRDNNFGCVLTELDSEQEKKDKIIAAVKSYNSYDYSRQYSYCQEYYDMDRTREGLIRDLEEIIKER